MVELAHEMPLSCTVQAQTFDSEGQPLAKSEPLAFDGAKYAPTYVGLPLDQNRVVTPRYTFRMSTTARVTHATIYFSGKSVWTGT